MQVILLERIKHLGDLGDVVKVRDGFARNFLFPRQKAKRATALALKEFEAQRAELEKVALQNLELAQQVAEKLDGLTVQFVEKAGVDGRLFGSVNALDIAKALEKLGFVVTKNMIILSGGMIKAIGDHEFFVQLHTDIKVKLTASVSAEATI